MFRPITSALVVTAALAPPVGAVDASHLVGLWEQIAGDRGACPTCRIAFRRWGPGISVVANNGWQATLPHGDDGRAIEGSGRWPEEELAYWTSGRPFRVRFHLQEEGRLDMTMVVRLESNETRVVRASYRRIWQGL